jgi:hypothetical protein
MAMATRSPRGEDDRIDLSRGRGGLTVFRQDLARLCVQRHKDVRLGAVIGSDEDPTAVRCVRRGADMGRRNETALPRRHVDLEELAPSRDGLVHPQHARAVTRDIDGPASQGVAEDDPRRTWRNSLHHERRRQDRRRARGVHHDVRFALRE